ncbi:MAG TPA: phosphatase PAP2 family protein [Ilumatobacter sp.]
MTAPAIERDAGAPDLPLTSRRGPAWLRPAVVAAYVAVFIASMIRFGLPADRVMVVTWAVAGVICINVGRPWRSQLQLVTDWAIFVLLLFAYDYSRGAADGLGRPIHVTGPRDMDRLLFFGADPNVWMQDRLHRPTVQWYDALASIVYMTHFVVPIAIAMILWARARPEWVRWMRRFGTLLAIGVVTYILYPAAPPWYASQQGELGEIHRLSGRGWRAMGFDVVSNVLKRGQEISNPFAAVPSLHAAFSLLAVAFFLPGRSRRVQALMLLFPLSMAWTLVYAGEHYVIDIIAGWLYVVVVMLAWTAWENRQGALSQQSGLPRRHQLSN